MIEKCIPKLIGLLWKNVETLKNMRESTETLKERKIQVCYEHLCSDILNSYFRINSNELSQRLQIFLLIFFDNLDNFINKKLKLLFGNLSITIQINFFENLIDFFLCRMHDTEPITKSPHQHSQLVGLDPARFVHIEQLECLFQGTAGGLCLRVRGQWH